MRYSSHDRAKELLARGMLDTAREVIAGIGNSRHGHAPDAPCTLHMRCHCVAMTSYIERHCSHVEKGCTRVFDWGCWLCLWCTCSGITSSEEIVVIAKVKVIAPSFSLCLDSRSNFTSAILLPSHSPNRDQRTRMIE